MIRHFTIREGYTRAHHTIHHPAHLLYCTDANPRSNCCTLNSSFISEMAKFLCVCVREL